MIRQAWAITWRYRFLWLLGVLAGGAVGVPSMNRGGGANTRVRGDSDDLAQLKSALPGFTESVSDWVSANVGLLIGLAVLGFVIVLALIVLSVVAQGGMARATADLATGRPSSLGSAWAAGVRMFWRYVGLWLTLGAVAFVVGSAIAVCVGAAVLAFNVGLPVVSGVIAALIVAAVVTSFVTVMLRMTRTSTTPRWLVVVASALFALPVLPVLLVVALSVSIVVAFAQRAIAIDNVGPWTALRSGWQLARAHLGESFVTWLVNLGLALVAGIVLAVTIIGGVLVLAAGGAAVVLLTGFSVPTIIYASLAILVLLAVGLTVAGAANTFFWTFWTLVYLRLRGVAAAPAPVS